MDKAIARVIKRKYPELNRGWHLPLFARVVDQLGGLKGETVSEEKPYYSVSVQLLTASLDADHDVPVIEDVLVPLNVGGAQRGLWGKPTAGTIVELAFAYGSPAHPFVRSVMPHGLKTPSMGANDQRWQQSEQTFWQVDAEENWTHHGESVSQNIRKSYEQCVGESLTQKIEKDLTQQIGNLKETIAKKHWQGDTSTNIYELLLQLMKTVSELAQVTATHSHPYSWSDPGGMSVTSPPLQVSAITGTGAKADQLSSKLGPLLK